MSSARSDRRAPTAALELEVLTTADDVRALRRARASLPPALDVAPDESWHRLLAQRPTSAGWPPFEL